MQKLLFTFPLLALLLLVADAGLHAQPHAPGNTGKLNILIEPVFNDEPLRLGDKQYISANGDSLYIDLFRFYLSNLQGTGSATFKDTASHLADAEDTATLSINIDDIPTGSYTSLNYIIGVDSLANVSGAMAGDLDPVKGMYWAWNTGYIMAKVEGRSAICKTIHHAFEFHIGGYLPPYNAARQVMLPATFVIKENATTTIKIKANVAQWLTGKKTIALATTNSIVMPGAAAMQIADNYSKMFSVSSISTP